MKNSTIIGLGIGGLALGGLLYFWSKAQSAKSFIQNLTIEPLWYGGVNDMKFSTTGVKLPLAVDLGNRSNQEYKIRINACDIFLGEQKVAASKAALVEAVLKPQSTTRIPIDVVINYAFLVDFVGLSVTSLMMGEGANGIVSAMNQSLKIRLDFAVNDAIQTPLTINLESGEVSLSGLGGARLRGGVGLVSYEDRQIGSFDDYKYLLPENKPTYEDKVVVEDVTPEQTARAIRAWAKECKWQTAALAKSLKGSTVRETIQNVFGFVYKYVKYEADSVTVEQVRSPLRCLYDQKGDCDCYTLLIASIFENLGIPYVVRIAEYNGKGYYQHVYAVALINGNELACDPVLNRCFEEKPYTRKKDF